MTRVDPFRLRVPETERSFGMLSDVTLRDAERRFAEHGCLVLEGLFDTTLVERLHQTYESHLGSLGLEELERLCRTRGGRHDRYLEVGERRFEIAPQMVSAFGDPNVYGSPLLLPLLRRWLGEECQLNSFTVVIAYPGAALQHIHRDAAHLFAGHPDEVSTSLPPFAVNVGIALVDVDATLGPTGVLLGSHRWPTDRTVDPAALVPVPMQRGDCLITDFRLLHGGMPNTSERVRPNLYLSYTRPWFFDETNHTTRNPTDLPLGAQATHADQRVLLRRALARRTRSWAAPQRQGADTADADPKRPCPCGSGLAHGACHGLSEREGR